MTAYEKDLAYIKAATNKMDLRTIAEGVKIGHATGALTDEDTRELRFYIGNKMEELRYS